MDVHLGIFMQLKHGVVTTNGHWISYKTNSYEHNLAFIKACCDELYAYLDSVHIPHSEQYTDVIYAGGTRRAGCLTVAVLGTSDLPYEDSYKD